jgi:glycosyltransferase involved in cell wall biosynthesis
MSKLKINIICGEADSGWIYSQFIQQFKKYSKHEILINSKKQCDVCHALPYYESFPTNATRKTAWFSHQEERADLHKKFISAAKEVDVAISQSKRYATVLRDNHELHNVIQVMAGVDLDKFTLRETVNVKSKKLIVGYVGRQYSSSKRKNPSLLDKISKLNFIDFRTTGGKLKPNQIPKFYKGLHTTISPAIIEGGPMSVQESLASGVPIVCLNNVGVANEFNLGVLRADNNDHFISILKEMHKTKSHIAQWSNPDVMERMRNQVEKHTWEKFVYEHDKIWQMITTKSWNGNNNEKG